MSIQKEGMGMAEQYILMHGRLLSQLTTFENM